MYRHIMYRGKNTSVPTVETCRGASLHYVSGHVVHITCRGLSRQTLRVGARRTHCVSGFVASNITCRGTSYTLRVGVCRVEHCRIGAHRTHYVSGFVVSNIVVSWFVVLVFVGNDEQRSTLQHYNNITKRQQSTTKSKQGRPLRSSLLTIFSILSG